jgi:YD repeat-containing protein
MVAVVTGNSLGLVAGSAGVLGGNGQLGSAATGRGGDVAFVNASTGNLTIQRQDELLLGLGPDIGIVRTYNSNGTFDFDNNDNWQISLYRRVFGLTGGTGVNTAGSTIKRTSADGAELTYTYDATLLKYVNKDGAGSYDTLTYNSGTDKWTWVDGDSRITETFELQVAGTYRIKTLADTDGNAITYSYNNATDSLITQVLSANGERTDLIYNATKQLTQINVVNSSSVTTTRVRYTYESALATARLTSVSTDLTPADGVITDNNTYVTSYGYDGVSKRITSIVNSVGASATSVTRTDFTYETSGLFRVLTVKDGANNITTFAYPTTSTATVTDAKGQITTLTYSILSDSSQKLLTRIQGPVGSGQDINYLYDTNGNVTQMTDSRGNVTKYTYDSSSNQTRQEDAAGNTITRTYSATNQLLSETVYATPDTLPGDVTYNAAIPQTTRYVYDIEEHLRFMISPEGRVTEYKYNSNGTRASAIQYGGLTTTTTNVYTTAGTPTEAQLDAWVAAVAGADKAKSQRSDYTYDVRGQLSTSKVYASVDAAGLGITSSQAITQYTYDQRGNLTQSINARNFMTGYSYDGLNRLSTQTDALSNVTNTIYNDTSAAITTTLTGTTSIAANSVAVRLANGLVIISAYDAAGRLISTKNANAANDLGTTTYFYNTLGQLVRSTDATAQNTYYIYDTLGRKVGTIDPQLALTEYVYNNNNQVVRIVQYNAAVSAALSDATALTNTIATVGIRNATPATDRVNRNLYDKAGRLAKQIDAVGAVTEYQYDGASRLVKTISYANLLTGTQLTALAALTTEPLATDVNTIAVVDATKDRITRQLYSNDGLLLGKLDAEGYFSSYSYDAASRNTSITRYRNAAQLFGTATLDSGIPTVVTTAPTTGNVLYVLSDTANDQASYNLYNARGQLEGTVDALGYLTEFQYDLTGNRTVTKRYADSIVYTPGTSLTAVLAALSVAAATNIENQSTAAVYDANNRISSNTSSPDGLITNYTYDAVGNLTQQVRTYTGATALDNRSQFKQYDLLGRVTRELSGQGVLALQALVSPTQLQIDGVWDSYGTRYSYDLAGRVIIATAANGSNAAGNKSLYYYDTEGKLKYQINAVGEVTEFIYNQFDQRTATRQYKTRLVAATLASMQTVAATATTGVVSTTVNTAANTALTALNTGVASYTETLTAYDNAGRANTLTDALGNANTRTYNAFGELFTATNKIDASNNLITSYSYDKRGMVKTTTEDSAGINRITQAVYDAFGRITQTTDGRGGVVNRAYDKLGREVVVTNALTTQTQTTYDAFSRVLTRRDGRGVAGAYNTVSYSYNSTARSMTMTTGEGISVVTTRNRFGETVQVTDGRLNNTSYTYNADGQLRTTTTATGTVAAPTTSTTTINYDAAGKVLNSVDAKLTQTAFTYDAANRVLSRSVDPAGLDLKTEYRYDALGRQAWVQDAKGIWTRTDYDNKGQVTSIVVDPSTIPGTADANGLFTTVANPAGVLSLNITTNFTYDARGKRLTVVEGFGSPQTKTTGYVYDKLGRLQQTIVDPGVGKLNLTTSYTYDKNDNVVLKTDARNNKTVYTYDANNRLIYTVDALGNVTKNDYDVDGNVLTTTAYGEATSVATRAILANLQLNPTSTAIPLTVDATNRINSNVYDKDNRRISSTDALGIITQYTYDENGNQTEVKEAVGTSAQRITKQEFDAANRKTAAVNALGYRTETTYDATGNIVTVKDALGNMGYFYYDAANRMTLQVNPTGPQGTINFTATELKYDALGNQTDIIRYANAITSTPVVGTRPTLSPNTDLDQLQKVTYDAASRKLNIKTAVANTGGQTLDASNSYTESFTYDALGNVLSSTARNGATTNYTYDAVNRKATETLPITSRNAANTANIAVQNSFSYDALGNLTTKTEAVGLPEQRVTSYTYTLNNQQATESVNVYLNSTQSSVASTKSKAYDAHGNVKSETDANNKTTYYYYDLQNRRTVTVDANSVMTAMVYDAVGNKTSQTTHVALANWPTTANAPTPAINAANDRSMFYTYDAVGREISSELRNMVVGTVSASNTYNALTTANLTKQVAYDANGNVVRSVDANGNITRAYYRQSGEKIAEVDAAGYLTRWTYDVYGNLNGEYKFAKKPSEASTPLNVTDATSITEILAVVDLLFVSDANVRAITRSYDRVNRVLTESRANVVQGTVNTTNGALTTSTANATTTYTYNGLNNVMQKTDAVGATTNWFYDNIGRETNQSDPVFTDNTGNTAARKRMNKEYDGLNNLKRDITRGSNDAVETDDQITTYTYSTGGRLIAETDAVGAVIQYEYDNTGNILKRSLKNRRTADQIINNQAGADDVTLYTYDNVNRQLSTSTKSIAETTYTFNQVQYSSFGEVINKRTYTNSTGTLSAAGTWDEFAEYDQAGRIFKTNSEDGVVKVMAYDANGNVTIRITSTDNTNTISATQNTAAGINALLAIPNTLRTMSVYDARNRLTTTLQASMDSTRTVAAIVTNTNSEVANAPPNPLTGSVTSAVAASNPIAQGSSTLGFGNVGWGYSFAGGATSPARVANVTITIPTNINLTGGAMRVDVYMTSVGANTVNGYSYGYIAAGSSTVTITLAAASGQALPKSDVYAPTNYSYPTATSFRLIVSDANNVKFTDQTWTPVSTQVWVPTYTTGTGAYVTTVAAHWETRNIMPTSGASAAPKRIYLTGQPPATTTVYLSYRAAGSTGAYSLVGVPQMVNTAGAAISGMFAFDWSTIPAGNYEYQYSALDAAGNLLNQQSGTFNTTNAAAPTISAQTPIATGGIGRAFVDQYAIRLLNQGSNAASVNMRYRIAGTNPWSAPVALVKNSLGVDSFYLAAGNFGLFANSTTYEVDYEVNDASNNLLRIASSYIVKDAAGNISIKDGVGNANNINPIALSLIKVRLGNQVVGTTYIDLTIRPLGATSAYLPLTRIYANNLGKFDFSIIGMTGNQDIDMRAYNASNEFINHNKANIYFNQATNVVTVLSVSSLPIPQTIVIKPTQTSSDIVNPAVSSVAGTVTSAQAASTPAIGSSTIGNGSVTWSSSISINAGYGHVNSSVSIPTSVASGLGGGNLRIQFTYSIYNLTNGAWSSSTVTANTTDGVAIAMPTLNIGYAWAADIRGVSFSVYKSTAQGEVLVASGSKTGGPLLGGYTTPAYVYGGTQSPPYYAYSSSSGVTLENKRLYLTGQPPATTTVYLSYRAAGSTGAYSLVGVPQMLNTAGAAMSGMFAYDWSTIAAGNYEYQYSALDAAGNLLNQQSGTFNTTNAAAPAISAQTPIATGGIGRAFVDQYAIRILNQGSNAASMNMRYRVAGTSYWSAPVALVKNSLGVDSFYLAAANFGLFANSTTYEVDYEVNDAGGNVLRVVSNQIVKDAAGNISLKDGLGNAANAASKALSLTKIRLGGQPAATTYIDWGSRPMGSTAAYTPGVRIYPNSYGQFDLSIVGMPVGSNQEIDINAYNAAGLLINRSQADLYINQPANVVTVLAQRAINIPQISVSNADYVILGYRRKNTTDNYTMLPAKQLVLNNGVKEVRIELPLTLANGDYEYQYTTYTAEALNPNAQGSLFVEDFSGPTNKLTEYSDPDNLIVVTGQGTADGSVTMTSNAAAVTSYPALLSPTYTYTAGSLFHAEVTTNELSASKWSLVGIQGSNAAGQFMRHGLMMDGNNLYARTDDGAGLNATNLLTTNAKANTTYVVEVETTATGTKLYVFEKGKTRAEGWSETRTAGAWANMYIALYSLQLAGRGTSSVTIDNIGLINNPNATGATTKLGGSEGTFTIGVGTTTANTRLDWALSTSSTVASIQRQQTFNAFGEIETEIDGNGNRPMQALFKEDFSGATNTLSPDASGLIVVSGQGTAAGKMTFSTAATTTAAWPAVVSPSQTYVPGMLFHAEVNTNDVSPANGKYLLLGVQGTDAAGQYRRHVLYIDTNSLYSNYHDSSIIGGSTYFAPTKPNTVYVVEVETSATGTTLYIFEKGKTRAEGWTETRTAGPWATIQIAGWAYQGPGRVASSVTVDNLSLFAPTTSFTYNTLGKLISKRDAAVNVTAENGEVKLTAPVTSYTYDAIGRMIATTDANNNINTQAWLAGSSSNEQILFEKHADGGIKTRQFDIFGNKVKETDEANRTTTYGYDKANQLTQITRPSGAIDRYYYDAAGQRIIHANALTVYDPITGALTATSAVEKTNYDSLGRITQTITNMGFATSYSYTYTTAVIGLGGAMVSGWVKTTTDALGRTIQDKTDMFDRTFSHKDLGDNLFTYHYNRAGWLTSQTGTTGQNIAYNHYANGYIKSIHDKSLGMFTYYEYDGNGNRRYEGYAALKDKTNANAGFAEFYQQATIAYDRLNRMTSVTDPKAKIEYQYDAVGNRRSVKSIYHDGVNGNLQVQEYWYKYDVMNRFLITMGTLAGGVITKGAGATGADIAYNFAGQRTKATNAVDGSIEDYTYNADGYLTNIHINGTLRSTRTNDLLGRTTNLTEYAATGGTISYNQTSTYDKDNRNLSQVDNLTNAITNNYFYYDTSDNTDVGLNYSAAGAGELALSYSDSNGAGAGGTLVSTIYGYEYFDDAKIAAIVADPYNKISKKNNRIWKNGYTDITFDVNGHIDAAVDRVGKRNIRYITDAQGLILLRDEITGTIDRPNYRYFASTYTPGSIANKVQRYYYVDGKRVGDVGNDGPSRTDYITSMANRSSQTGNYANWRPVGSADFDQNYEPISPTNPGPVSSSYTVRNGDTLQSIAATVWGDSAMWYLIADANGLISGSTLNANQVLVIPNKVTNIHNNAGTFRPYNPGEAIGDLNPTIPAMPKPPKKKKCGGLGAIIAAVVSVVATYVLGPIGGNLVSQVFNNVIGIQKGFSFSSFATSVISFYGGISPFSGGGPLAAAGNAVVNNVVSQGLGIITGEQKGFSWSSVAASAVGGAVGNYVGGKLDAKFPSTVANPNLTNNIIKGVASGIAGNVASQLTQIAIDGRGRLNWTSVAVSGIYGVGSGLEANRRLEALIAADKLKQGNTNSAPGINLNDVTGTGVQFTQEQRALAFASTEDLMKTSAQRGGLSVSYFDNGLTSQDDLAAIQAGGLRVQSYGDVKDVTQPADRVKVSATNLNNANIESTSKNISSFAPSDSTLAPNFSVPKKVAVKEISAINETISEIKTKLKNSAVGTAATYEAMGLATLSITPILAGNLGSDSARGILSDFYFGDVDKVKNFNQNSSEFKELFFGDKQRYYINEQLGAIRYMMEKYGANYIPEGATLTKYTFKDFGPKTGALNLIDGIQMSDIIGTFSGGISVKANNGMLYFKARNNMSLESFAGENLLKHGQVTNPASGPFSTQTQVFQWEIPNDPKFYNDPSYYMKPEYYVNPTKFKGKN